MVRTEEFAGEILALHIRTTLRDYGRAVSEIDQLKTGMRGLITVACIESALADVILDLVHSFAQRFPRLELNILGCPADQAVRAVLSGIADVCVIFNPPPRLPLLEIATAKFPLGIVTAPQHPLATRNAAKLSDLIGHQLVLRQVASKAFAGPARRASSPVGSITTTTSCRRTSTRRATA